MPTGWGWWWGRPRSRLWGSHQPRSTPFPTPVWVQGGGVCSQGAAEAAGDRLLMDGAPVTLPGVCEPLGLIVHRSVQTLSLCLGVRQNSGSSFLLRGGGTGDMGRDVAEC